MSTLTIPKKRDKAARPTTGQAAESPWVPAAKPTVSLLPRYIKEKQAAARTKRHTLVALGLLAFLVCGGIVGSYLVDRASEQALAEAITAKESALTEVTALAPIASYYDGLAARRTAVETALAQDVTHADLLGDIIDAMPSGVSLTGYATETGSPCSDPDPFEPVPALGCLNISATAANESQVAQTVKALAEDKQFDGVLAEPFVSGLTTTDKVEFNVSVNFTDHTLSLRFLSDEARQAIEDQRAATTDEDDDQ